MKNRTENISVRYRPQHLTKSQTFISDTEVVVINSFLQTALT